VISGNWNNGVNAGPRCVNANNYPWNVNMNIGARLACDNFLCHATSGKDVCRITVLQTVTAPPQAAIRKENRQIDCPHLRGG
jgi:hypothetical protein